MSAFNIIENLSFDTFVQMLPENGGPKSPNYGVFISVMLLSTCS